MKLMVAFVQKKPRRRRVRFSYPQTVVDLVLSVIPIVGVREIARSADIPPSVIYRWRDHAARAGALPVEANASRIAELIWQCRQTGCVFDELFEAVNNKMALLHETGSLGGGSDGHEKSGDYLLQASRSSDPGTCKPIRDAHRRRRSCDVTSDAMRRLESAKKIMEERYFDSINCGRLADIAGMSRTYFIFMFGNAFGMTPHQYLLRVRIATAKKLLMQSYESIDVVAAAVGFRTGANLGRAFKQIEGKNVSEILTFTTLATQKASKKILANAPPVLPFPDGQPSA